MGNTPSFAKVMQHQPVDDEATPVTLEDGQDSLDFLQAVYRDPRQPMRARIRCAIEAAQSSGRDLAQLPMAT